MDFLSQADPEIGHAVYMEAKRQKETINLTASENYLSRAVFEAQGSLLANKTLAEGYPQRCRPGWNNRPIDGRHVTRLGLSSYRGLR